MNKILEITRSFFSTEFKAEFQNEIFPLTASYVTACIQTAPYFSPLNP